MKRQKPSSQQRYNVSSICSEFWRKRLFQTYTKLSHVHFLISNWPLYKIWYYATYLINASKMWSPSIVHINLSINGKKNRFHVQTVLVER